MADSPLAAVAQSMDEAARTMAAAKVEIERLREENASLRGLYPGAALWADMERFIRDAAPELEAEADRRQWGGESAYYEAARELALRGAELVARLDIRRRQSWDDGKLDPSGDVHDVEPPYRSVR